MALKPNIVIDEYVVGAYATGVMTRGGIVCAFSGFAGSGTNLDSNLTVVEYATSPSGRYPIGVLLYDTVNQDVTDQPLNRHKHLALVNNKVPVGSEGTIVTNSIVPGTASSVVIGQPAYLGVSGLITNVNTWPTYGAQVGVYMGRVDQDGYVRIKLDI